MTLLVAQDRDREVLRHRVPALAKADDVVLGLDRLVLRLDHALDDVDDVRLLERRLDAAGSW